MKKMLSLLCVMSFSSYAIVESNYSVSPAEYSFDQSQFSNILSSNTTMNSVWNTEVNKLFSINGVKELKLIYPKCLDLQILDADLLAKLLPYKTHVQYDAQKWFANNTKDFAPAIKAKTIVDIAQVSTLSSLTQMNGKVYQLKPNAFNTYKDWIKNFVFIKPKLIDVSKIQSVWVGDKNSGGAKCQMQYTGLERKVLADKYRDTICYDLGIPAAKYVEPTPPRIRISCSGSAGQLDLNNVGDLFNNTRAMLSDEFIRRFIVQYPEQLRPIDPRIAYEFNLDSVIRHAQLVNIASAQASTQLSELIKVSSPTALDSATFNFLQTPSYNIEALQIGF